MSKLDLQIARRQALAVVASQVMLGAIVAVACFIARGVHGGASALLGAGIGVVASSLMAFAMLRHSEAASAQRVAWSFFSGWLVKVGFTVAMLVLAFRSRQVDAVPLLLAYAATYAGYWIGAARAGGQNANR